MIWITSGVVITVISLIGIIGCFISLIVTVKVFKKQRKDLLNRIEEG